MKTRTFAFIDASNLFYGGEKSLGWKIDYQKLARYLERKYGAKELFYYGGIEIYDFPYDPLKDDSVETHLNSLEKHLATLLKNDADKFDEATLLLLSRHLGRVRFYQKLKSFGYKQFLKPVKTYTQDDGTTKRKANCDVDLTFHLMREQDNYDRVIVLSGDGDFLSVLKHLQKRGKTVVILARGPRTAKEIRRFAGANFRDFEYLKFEIGLKTKG